MIDIDVKIHDRFSIEFKVGFVVRRVAKRNDFAVNSWIYLPNSLDINPVTYDKQSFYRDVKSNVRLITPRFLLGDMVGGRAVPLHHLRIATEALNTCPSRENILEYEYQVKMFAAIFKSSQRDAAAALTAEGLSGYIEDVRAIAAAYRALQPSATGADYFSFGDEFLSNIIQLKAYSLVGRFGELPSLISLVADEDAYKTSRGYLRASPDDAANNREMVFRHGTLKKYVESGLFLVSRRKKDGRIVEQLLYSIAAGISMVFATAVAFWGQVRFGSVATPFFFALVISYMLKDRIKDVLRYYFSHSLSRRYFDNKTHIAVKETEIGWIKEAVDFVGESKVPRIVSDLRGRSSLLEAENRVFDEKILLYRKLVRIDHEVMDSNNEYRISGVNDVMRLHFTRFVEKLDNPDMPLELLSNGHVAMVESEKGYRINIILQLQFDSQTVYKRFRVLFTRAGITHIEELH